MITKQIAGLLYSFSYQLQDNEGNVYWIEGVENCPYDDAQLTLELMGHKLKRITNKEIGSTYKILAREIQDITKEIDNGEIPLLKLNKEGLGLSVYRLEFVGKKWHLLVDHHRGLNALSERAKEYLMSLHFSIGFPEGTTTNLI